MSFDGTITPQAGFLGKCTVTHAMQKSLQAFDPDTGATNEVITISSSSAANSTTYAYTISKTFSGGEVVSALVSFTTDGTATDQELITGLRAAHNASPSAGAIAAATGTTTLILTEVGGAGVGFTVTLTTNPSTVLSQAATTAAAVAPTYSLGYWYPLAAPSADGTTIPLLNQWADVSVLGDLLTITIVYGAGSTNIGDITITDALGESYVLSYSVVGDTDTATTIDNVATALAASATALGINTLVTLTDNSTNLTLQAPPGWQINGVESVSGGAGTQTFAVTAGSTVPTMVLCADPGNLSVQASGIPATAYPSGVQILAPVGDPNEWGIVAPASGTVTFGNRVYINATTGRAETAASATNFLHPTARFVRTSSQDSTLTFVKSP
jgi:hypothetical protein